MTIGKFSTKKGGGQILAEKPGKDIEMSGQFSNEDFSGKL